VQSELSGERLLLEDAVEPFLVDLRGARFTAEQEVHFRKCGAILEARV